MLKQLYHGRMTSDGFLTRQEAAEQLGIPLAGVDRLIDHGLLDRYRIRVRVTAGQVAELARLPREWLLRC